MKVSFNFIIKGLDGVELSGQPMFAIHAGMLLANSIAGETKSNDIMRWMGWAQKLYAKQDIDVSDGERNELKEFIKSTQTLTLLCKEQLLNALTEKKQSHSNGKAKEILEEVK